MALKINEGSEPGREYVEIGETLWLDADGNVVSDGDPNAASLLATPGKRMSREDAERYGLVKARAKSGDKQRKPSENK